MRITYDRILELSFLLMSIIFLCNLNGLLYLTLGIRAPFSLLILLLSVIIIGISVLKKQYKISGVVIILLLLMYILYLYIGLVVVLFDDSILHPKTSIPELLRSYISSILIILSCYYTAIHFKLKNNISGLFRILLFSSLISMIVAAIGPFIGLTDLYGFGSGGIVSNERVSGLFGNPNETGAFAMYFLALVLASYSFFRKWTILLLPLIGLAYYVSFMSFSRASIILINFIFLLYIIMHLKRMNKFRLKYAPRTILFSFLIFFTIIVGTSKFLNYFSNLSYSQQTRLLQTFELVGGRIDETTTSHRSEVYSFVLEQISHRPIFGYGLGSHHRIINLPGPSKLGTHNTQLLIWAESGIIPILLFVIALLILGIKAWRFSNPSLGFLVASIVIIYFVSVAGTGHNALDDRTSNVLIGISIGLLLNVKTEAKFELK